MQRFKYIVEAKYRDREEFSSLVHDDLDMAKVLVQAGLTDPQITEQRLLTVQVIREEKYEALRR